MMEGMQKTAQRSHCEGSSQGRSLNWQYLLRCMPTCTWGLSNECSNSPISSCVIGIACFQATIPNGYPLLKPPFFIHLHQPMTHICWVCTWLGMSCSTEHAYWLQSVCITTQQAPACQAKVLAPTALFSLQAGVFLLQNTVYEGYIVIAHASALIYHMIVSAFGLAAPPVYNFVQIAIQILKKRHT